MRKGQAVTMDLISGLVLFALFVAIFLFIVFSLPDARDEPQFEHEMLFVFDNLEKNLEVGGEPQFYKHYRVNTTNLAVFDVGLDGERLDDYLLGNSTIERAGIALEPDGYDTCLFFMHGGSIVPIGSVDAIGVLQGRSCHEAIGAGDVCDGYRQGMTVFRPVLWDVGDVNENKIVQMNVIACKI